MATFGKLSRPVRARLRSATAQTNCCPPACGSVRINKHGGVDPRIPFGGAKQSGYGLEVGVEGLKASASPK
jgi:hypothetical protein